MCFFFFKKKNLNLFQQYILITTTDVSEFKTRAYLMTMFHLNQNPSDRSIKTKKRTMDFLQLLGKKEN